MATYRGERAHAVYKNGEPFSHEASLKLANKSPSGFSWGYGGSGPAQLALALLYDVTGDGEKALRWYQTFKWDLVAGWGNVWWITSATIEAWIERKEGEGHENEAISPC